VQTYAAELDFLVVSCQPCDTRRNISSLEIVSANSGYLIILFKPEYSGTFSLFLHEGQVTKQSFLFNVEQHVHVLVHAPLHISALHDIGHSVGYPNSNLLDVAADVSSTSIFSSSDPSLTRFDGHDGVNRAVATMISTDSYVTGALVLLWGIVNFGRVGSSRFICMVTESVSDSARMRLKAAGWELFAVSAIESDSSDIVEEKWRQQFTKLHLFSLTNYSQILYLDSDTIVRGSLERAWLCTAPLCGAPDVFHPVFFNCGVLVLVPNRTEMLHLLAALPSLPAHESEQSALNEYFLKRFQPLHITLNFQKHR
jgi:hypothetical protein